MWQSCAKAIVKHMVAGASQNYRKSYVLYILIYAASEGGSWGPLEGVLGASWGGSLGRGVNWTPPGALWGTLIRPPESAVNNRVRGA